MIVINDDSKLKSLFAQSLRWRTWDLDKDIVRMKIWGALESTVSLEKSLMLQESLKSLALMIESQFQDTYGA